MHTSPVTEVTEASPEVLVEKGTALAAALRSFQMLCERMTRLEDIAKHWLHRERDRGWMQDGQLDNRLLGLPL